MKNFTLKITAAAVLALGLTAGAHAGLVNGGFETVIPPLLPNSFIVTPAINVPGWSTSAGDGMIEVWRETGPGILFNAPTTPAHTGTNYAELNATTDSTLYQDIGGVNTITAGAVVGWQLAHRGRLGIDVMQLTITDLGLNNAIGGGDDTVLFTQQFSDGPSAWGFYQGTGLISLGNSVRFAFGTISSAGGLGNTYGNFLDSTDFGVDVGNRVPEPASMLLTATALLAAGLSSRRRRNPAA